MLDRDDGDGKRSLEEMVIVGVGCEEARGCPSK